MSRKIESLINHIMVAVHSEVDEYLDAIDGYDAKEFDRDPDKVTVREAWEDLSLCPTEKLIETEAAMDTLAMVFDAYLDAAQDFEVLDEYGRKVITKHCNSFKDLRVNDEGAVGTWLNVLHTTLEELIKEKDYKED